MIKKLKIFVPSLALLFFALNVFAASEVHYGLKSAAESHQAQNSQVFLVNYSGYDYTAYGTFYPTGKSTLPTYLGYYGSGYNSLVYNINFPDNQVCLSVVRNIDGWIAYADCDSYGTIIIGSLNDKSSKPRVTVSSN